MDAEIIYPNLDSKWVTLVLCISKKGGMTKNELILTRTVTRWRICMYYKKLNNAIRKDQYPMSFIKQMLDR